jgi:DNA ligase-associated metallophosphoesterase
MVIEVAGEQVELLADRGVYWPSRQMLIIADLHLGKTESFRAQGVPLPEGVLRRDLERLDGLLERTGARRLMVLGDLIHAGIGLVAELVDGFGQWRAGRDIEIDVVPGNHDRALPQVADRWKCRIGPEVLVDGPFAFTHLPREEAGGAAYVWAGHVHPAITISGRGDAMRLACFHLGPRVGVLPAFSVFTGRKGIRREAGDRVFAVAGERLVEVPGGNGAPPTSPVAPAKVLRAR